MKDERGISENDAAKVGVTVQEGASQQGSLENRRHERSGSHKYAYGPGRALREGSIVYPVT